MSIWEIKETFASCCSTLDTNTSSTSKGQAKWNLFYRLFSLSSIFLAWYKGILPKPLSAALSFHELFHTSHLIPMWSQTHPDATDIHCVTEWNLSLDIRGGHEMSGVKYLHGRNDTQLHSSFHAYPFIESRCHEFLSFARIWETGTDWHEMNHKLGAWRHSRWSEGFLNAKVTGSVPIL